MGADQTNTRKIAAVAVIALLVAAGGGLFLVRNHRNAREQAAAKEAQEQSEARRAASQPSEPSVTLGIMAFRSAASDPDSVWRREVLRATIHTQLSRLSGVKIYSKEFIDFLVSREGLTESEAATKLGIRKMLAGSVTTKGASIQLETHLVDVATGMLEGSYQSVGKNTDFVELQNDLVLAVIAKLHLLVPDAERTMLLDLQKKTDIEAIRALIDSERGAVVPAPPSPAARRPRAALPIGHWFEKILSPAPALAEGNPDNAPVAALLESYRQDLMSKNVDLIAALHTQFSDDQRAAQGAYFAKVRDLSIQIDDLDAAVVGGEAVVSYTRTDDFVDVRTSRPMHASVRLTRLLKREGERWKFAAGR